MKVDEVVKDGIIDGVKQELTKVVVIIQANPAIKATDIAKQVPQKEE